VVSVIAVDVGGERAGIDGLLRSDGHHPIGDRPAVGGVGASAELHGDTKGAKVTQAVGTQTSGGNAPAGGDGAKVGSVTGAVCLLGVMAGVQVADPTIASTVLADSSASLGMTGGLQALAASVSTLVLAGTVVSTGILADRLGRRRILVAALACSIVGDLIAAGSFGPGTFLIGRALAGVGLGAVFAASFAYIRAIVPRGQLARANGIFAAVSAAALIVLAFLGGLVASLNWRLAYVVVPVAALVCLVATVVVLPMLPPVHSGPTPILGQVLLGAGVVSLLFGVSQAGRGLTRPGTWMPLVAGVVLLLAWYADQRRSAAPFFPADLLTNRVFVAAVAVGFVYNLGQAVVVLQTANLWQYLDSFTTAEVSAGQWPLLIALTVFSFLAGRWINTSMGVRTATVLGGCSLTAGFVWMAVAGRDGGYLAFVPGLVLVGVGIGLVQVIYATLILGLAPAEHLGPVTSAKTTIGQVAYSIGTSVSVIIVNTLTTGGVVRRLTEAGAPPTAIGEGLDAIRVYTTEHTAPSTPVGEQALAAAASSYASAFRITMVVFAALLAGLTMGAVRLLRSGSGPADVGRPVQSRDPSLQPTDRERP
jgi:MFS family permease